MLHGRPGVPFPLDVLVVGGCAIDYVVRARELPSGGHSVTGNVFLRDAGGKGLNQAIAAVRLGARTALIACVGDDAPGEDVLQALMHDGVDVEGVSRVPDVPSSRTLITVDERGRKQTASYPGANHELGADRLAAAFFDRAPVVLSQLEIPVTTVLRTGQLARQAGALFVLDAAPATPIADELIQLAEVITVNDEEAGVLSGLEVADRPSAMAAARAIRGRGARRVTIGIDEGRVAIDADGEHWLPSHGVPIVDTTGAGDACAAGIAVGLAQRYAFLDACVLGHAAAALATTTLGARASLPRRTAVNGLLAIASPAR